MVAGADPPETAVVDVATRCRMLRLAIADYIDVERYRSGLDNPVQDVTANLRHALYLDSVVSQANHLRRALERPGVPRGARESMQGGLSERILRLRDALEHWDKNRPDIQGSEARKARTKYAAAFPDKTPWSSSRSRDRGYTLGGLDIAELERALDKIEAVLKP